MRMLEQIYLNILESIVNNNLWKELAEQADEYADAKLQMPGEYHPDWHDVRDEKFAELIIGECLNQCYFRGMRDQLYVGQLRAALYIEQHFGAEP